MYRIILTLVLLLTVTTARVEGQPPAQVEGPAPNQPPPGPWLPPNDFRIPIDPTINYHLDPGALSNPQSEWESLPTSYGPLPLPKKWLGHPLFWLTLIAIVIVGLIARAWTDIKGNAPTPPVTPSSSLPAQPSAATAQNGPAAPRKVRRLGP